MKINYQESSDIARSQPLFFRSILDKVEKEYDCQGLFSKDKEKICGTLLKKEIGSLAKVGNDKVSMRMVEVEITGYEENHFIQLAVKTSAERIISYTVDRIDDNNCHFSYEEISEGSFFQKLNFQVTRLVFSNVLKARFKVVVDELLKVTQANELNAGSTSNG